MPNNESPVHTHHGRILHLAHDIINGERQQDYGDPKESHALIGRYWSLYLEHRYGIKVSLQPQDVGFMMVFMKICRAKNDVPTLDTLVDMAGYLGLVGDFIYPAPDPSGVHNMNSSGEGPYSIKE